MNKYDRIMFELDNKELQRKMTDLLNLTFELGKFHGYVDSQEATDELQANYEQKCQEIDRLTKLT